MPKEMLTIVDRPVIQHVVDEAREAGIEHCIFVTGRNKGVIEDHFDRQVELEETLAERGKGGDLEALTRDQPGAGCTSFTRQQSPLGLGHAVWCARDIVGKEPFALLLPDMLHHGRVPCMKGMIDCYRKQPGNYVAVYEVPESQTHQYGIVGLSEPATGRSAKITRMVEKPAAGQAPSNLAISGRYILDAEIFEILARQARGAGGEIQLTDAMIKLAEKQPFYAYTFDGKVYDCGSKVGFLVANVAYALARDDIAPAFRRALGDLMND